MKKLSLMLVVSLGLLQCTFAQNKWAGYSQTFPSGFTKDSTKIGMVVNIEERNNDFWSITDQDKLQSGVLSEASFKAVLHGDVIVVPTYSNAPAWFFIKNINSKNAGDHEYRVSQDNYRAMAPWLPITKFDRPGFGAGAGRPGEMAVIGNFAANNGHQIIVDVRRKGSETMLSTAVVVWVPIKPMIKDVFLANDLNKVLNYLTHPWRNKTDRPAGTYPAKDGKLNFKATENSLVFCLNAAVTDKKQIEYQLIKDGKTYINWRANDLDNAIIWLKNLPHGNYRLKYRYTVQPEHVGDLDFIIKPAWYQTTAIKIIAGSLMAAFLGLVLLVIYLTMQKMKAKKELTKKAQLQLELQSIRSQLNPHFIFNALTSIQGLINKHDDLAANKYLSEFAQLLRNTLVNNNQEQVPLSVEVKNLETYLKLEQLRSGFNYTVNIDEAINTFDTEIPSLLIQPLLENAIKHGLAHLRENGQLTLDINLDRQNMVVTIADNGKGFDPLAHTTGFGLKLTRDRIGLYNKMPDQHIAFDIAAKANVGTTVTLTFKNWLNGN